MLPTEKWRRLADVVEAGPDKLTQHLRKTVLVREVYVGTIRPRRRDDIVAANLQRWVLLILLDRQLVNAAGAHAGRGLRSIDDPVRMLLHDLLIPHRLIIEAGDIHLVRKFVFDGRGPIVEGRCGRPRR